MVGVDRIEKCSRDVRKFVARRRKVSRVVALASHELVCKWYSLVSESRNLLHEGTSGA
jgi:hypothetical protein